MALSSSFLDDHSGGRFDPSASASSTMATAVTREPDTARDSAEGIGILRFLEGKSYFITGATGLLAKGKPVGHFPANATLFIQNFLMQI